MLMSSSLWAIALPPLITTQSTSTWQKIARTKIPTSEICQIVFILFHARVTQTEILKRMAQKLNN